VIARCLAAFLLLGLAAAPAAHAEGGNARLFTTLNAKLPGRTVFVPASQSGSSYDQIRRVVGDRTIGLLSFGHAKKAVVFVDHVTVQPEHQRKGVSALLYLELLRLHPDTREIRTELGGVNEAAIHRHLPPSPTRAQILHALRQTPAYKVRAKLGFGRIVEESTTLTLRELLDEGGAYLTVERDK
jgi:hypothetical protein